MGANAYAFASNAWAGGIFVAPIQCYCRRWLPARVTDDGSRIEWGPCPGDGHHGHAEGYASGYTCALWVLGRMGL